jgi:hypothetical protein
LCCQIAQWLRVRSPASLEGDFTFEPHVQLDAGNFERHGCREDGIGGDLVRGNSY